MEVLYSGFDTVDFAIQGAVPPSVLNTLAKAKEEAGKRRSEVLVELGPKKIAAHVFSTGLTGGHAYRISTGPIGEIIGITNSVDLKQWNLSVSIRAATLAAYGWREALRRTWETLEAIEAKVVKYSVRRLDYAIDIRLPMWDLRLNDFVCHARSTVRPHWGERDTTGENDLRPQAVLRGRRLQSVTIGKMPGRQVIVYDKRAASIQKKEYMWFDVWGLSRDTPDLEVMRVELRAGKRELRDRWQIKTFADVKTSIGDVFESISSKIRYVAPNQGDSNVSRQILDPVWTTVKEHLHQNLFECRSGLTPDQVIDLKRAEAIAVRNSLILGNAAGLAVALGYTENDALVLLPEVLSELAHQAILNDQEKLCKSIRKAQERLHFLN